MIFKILFGVWFLLMVAFSGDFSSVKMAILLVLNFICLIHIFFHNVKISGTLFNYVILWSFLFLLSYMYGVYNGFVFSFPLLFYFVLTPLLSIVISSKFTADSIPYFNVLIIASTAFVVLFNLYYIGYRLSFYQMPTALQSLNTFGGVKLGSEQLEVRMTSQASLIFLLPYLFTIYFQGDGLLLNKFSKFFSLIVLILGFVVVIFSGRRSLQVILFVGVFFNYVLFYFKDGGSFSKILKMTKTFFFIVLLFLLCFSIVTWTSGIENPIYTFSNTIILAFDSNQGGGIVRSMQSEALLEYLASSPIYGHGLNSHPIYIRNITEPWSYEWVYLALASQAGLIIFTFFIITIFFIFRKNFNLFLTTRQPYAIFFGAVSNGFLCFIIAGSSNPMVYFIWFWIISLICFNPCFKLKFRA